MSARGKHLPSGSAQEQYTYELSIGMVTMNSKATTRLPSLDIALKARAPTTMKIGFALGRKKTLHEKRKREVCEGREATNRNSLASEEARKPVHVENLPHNAADLDQHIYLSPHTHSFGCELGVENLDTLGIHAPVSWGGKQILLR